MIGIIIDEIVIDDLRMRMGESVTPARTRPHKPACAPKPKTDVGDPG